MSPLSDLLTLEAAQAAILARVRALPAEAAPTAEAAGRAPPPEAVRPAEAAARVLAEPAAALVDLPPFPSSAMDGFAVRSADTPGTLPAGCRIAAGRPSPAGPGPREASEI